MKAMSYLVFILALTSIQTGPASAQVVPDGWLIAPAPRDACSFVVACKGEVLLNSRMYGWGPNWIPYFGLAARGSTVEDSALVASAQAKVGPNTLACKQRVWQSGPNAVIWQFDLSAEAEIPLTMFCTVWAVSGAPEGDLELVTTDGTVKTMALRMGKGGLDQVAKATFRLKAFGALTFAFDPPTDLAFDNAVRVKLAGASMPAGKRTVKVTVSAETPIHLAYTPEDRAALNTTPAGPDWYPLQPVADLGGSVVSLENWLPKPAGIHGRVTIVGDHFEFADGARVKFWGTNLCYETTNPPRAEADFTAARFARYGINCVRFHKFLERGVGDRNDGTKLNPDGLARMDYFTAALAANGVYHTFSPFFGFHVGPGNKNRLLAYEEVARLKNAYGLINYAEDIQDLLVEMYTNLLTHKNPHTGKTCAQDPALAAVEIQNEDNILWGYMKTVYPACPTYARRLEERFADWLKARYGSAQKLEAAWGSAMKSGESLDRRNLAIQYDPWFAGTAHLPQQAGGNRTRLLDNCAFLHETQNRFYAKLVKAIRTTGYQGPIIGSPWQSPAMLPHYYNLKSDTMVGLVDRHNYFSGVESSMLARIGSGYLGTGLQQVLDRPFSVSEWIHVWPALYAAEGPAAMAVYGLGLQDWDASWQFQSETRITAGGRGAGLLAMRPLTGGREGDGYDIWNADTPANLGQYPALARMIYRGDVRAGAVISVRRVSDEALATGVFDFEDRVAQSGTRGDEKTLTSTVPAAALAAGRLGVQFTGSQPAKSTLPDMTGFDRNGVVLSNTGQLAWDYRGRGFFTVNTPGTKAAVGFHTGTPLAGGRVTIAPAAQFASIFLTALEPDRTLENCRGALVTALARQCNQGFSYFIDKSTVSNGKAPTLLEPVRATFTIRGRRIAAVHALSHEGRRAEGQSVTVAGDSFAIDTGRDQTFYYEVVFAE